MCSSYDFNVDKEIYPLNFAKPGIVFIFNNRNFSLANPGLGLKLRVGSEKDVQRIRDTFYELNFDVDCYIDKTAKKLRTCIRKISREVDYGNICSVLIFIMSHGKDDKIFCTDGEELYLSEFVEPFRSADLLKGKPKLFFLNACRGCMMAPTHDSNKYKHMVEMDAQAEILNETVSRTPLDADILLAFSTVENYFSIRESEYGSWYIQILCDVIEKYKTTKHLTDILTRVNDRVADKEGYFMNRNEEFERVKMVSTFTSRLKKDFYFTRPSHVK
jgi:caspase 7